MVTQRDIAKRAHTSLKTVSRVINRDPLVNAKTRARIEAIIAEIGYEPDQAARMMRSQQSNIIGFLADRVATTSSSSDLVRGAQDVAWQHGKQIMLFNIEHGTKSQQLAEAQLASFRAESVIYATRYHQPIRLAPSSIPRVLLNCFDPENAHLAIVPDDYRLAADLMEIIFARGYKRPVFLNLPATTVAAKLRAQGITDVARANGMDMKDRIYTAVVERNGETSFTADHLLSEMMGERNVQRPDLVICGQDILAMDVYFVLAGLGLKVGRDVAVASFDNFEPVAHLLKPGLSTMELPYYEMGRQAMLMAIAPPTVPSVIRLPGKFVERASL